MRLNQVAINLCRHRANGLHGCRSSVPRRWQSGSAQRRGDIAPALISAGARVRAYDLEGMAEAARLLPGVEMQEGPYQAAKGADVVVIVTEWDPFRALNLYQLKALMRRPVLVDLRNVYEPEVVRTHGFRYLGVGGGAAV